MKAAVLSPSQDWDARWRQRSRNKDWRIRREEVTIQFNHSALRYLTEAETREIRGGQDIVVVGRRYDPYVFGGYADYGSGVDPYPTLAPPDEGGGGAETPPDLDCRDPSLMTPEELRDYRVSQEAARVASEIMTKSDKDTNEYGAFIYRDTDGSIKHTPLARGGPDSVVPSFEGIKNWGQVLARIHSHPASQFSADLPEFKRFPTPNTATPDGKGDWYAFDKDVENIKASLQSDHGLSSDDAAAEAAKYRQYMLGPSGPMGSNEYGLHGYDTNDRDTQTLGQKINLGLGNCPG